MLLKSKPEDFIVEEVNNIQFNENGKYSFYKLKKINIETYAAVQQVADCFKINPKYINFAGLKDKKAITTQYISISHGPKKDVKNHWSKTIDMMPRSNLTENHWFLNTTLIHPTAFQKDGGFGCLKRDNIELTYLGTGYERLQLGMLVGNKFTITVREITPEEKKRLLEKIAEIKKIEKTKTTKQKKQNIQFINYYDEQRFGIHKDNHIIGRFLVKKQFKEALEELKKRKDYHITLVCKYLEKHPKDIIGALREIPKKQLLLFVHAYQSYLWNETAKEYIKQKKQKKQPIDNTAIPIIGFALECDSKEKEKIILKIMKKENISERDFVIRQMPEITAAGGKRNLLMDCRDFCHTEIDDKTIKLQFFLGKGSYATMLVKQLFA